MTTYDKNEFNQVVPYNNGRRSNNTAEYRDLTEYEEQLLCEIDDLTAEIENLQKKLNITANVRKEK